jgi:hypothetical protein
MRLIAGAAAAFTVAFVAGCNETPVTSPGADAGTEFVSGGTVAANASDAASQLTSMMDAINAGLAANGEDYRVVMAEAITAAESGEMGITVLAKDVGNKQLSFDFVPNDGRRPWSSGGGNAITYAIDQTGDAVPVLGGLTGAETTAAIIRGHDSWEALTCSAPGQTQNPDFGLDIGVVAFIVSGGAVGGPFVFADVQHAGWRDLNFGGGTLGVTFTFGFTGGSCSGIFTDIDGNGKCDTAFREIYYDPSFTWADDGSTNVDVESVAVHEIGHGLSQGHFGTVAFKNNGNLKRSPFAVMNAIYSQPLQVLQGTDNGGHCSNWGQWPNN